MAQDPRTILKELYKAKKLGPLYVIRPPILIDQQGTAGPEEWVYEFYKDIIKLEKNISPEHATDLEKLGVSDLYHIKKNKEHKEYKVEEEGILEFVKAHTYPPLEFSYKFIAVHEAEKLSEKIANKWLKTLEEPIQNVVTLFLTNSNRPLLQTIESRAISLRIKPGATNNDLSPTHEESFPSYLARMLSNNSPISQMATEAQKKNLNKFIREPQRSHFFLDSLKSSRGLQSELFKILQSYVQSRSASPRLLDQWLAEIKWYEEASAYNNAPQERFLGMLQLVQSMN